MMDRTRWPLVLVSAALLLGAGASTAASGAADWLAGGLTALGAACIGAWITGMSGGDTRNDEHDRRRSREI